MKYVYTIREHDTGKSIIELRDRKLFLSGVLGRVQRQDVGKRIYESDGVLQVENEEQFQERMKHEESQP